MRRDGRKDMNSMECKRDAARNSLSKDSGGSSTVSPGSSFAARALHDIRNSVTAAYGYSQILARNTYSLDDEKKRRLAFEIEQSLATAIGVIRAWEDSRHPLDGELDQAASPERMEP